MVCLSCSKNLSYSPRYTQYPWKVNNQVNDELFTKGNTLIFINKENKCIIDNTLKCDFIANDSVLMISHKGNKLLYNATYNDSILLLKQLFIENNNTISFTKIKH